MIFCSTERLDFFNQPSFPLRVFFFRVFFFFRDDCKCDGVFVSLEFPLRAIHGSELYPSWVTRLLLFFLIV